MSRLPKPARNELPIVLAALTDTDPAEWDRRLEPSQLWEDDPPDWTVRINPARTVHGVTWPSVEWPLVRGSGCARIFTHRADEAWERLLNRNVLPPSWADHPRRFLTLTEHGPECLPNCKPLPGGLAGHSYRCPHFNQNNGTVGTYQRVYAESRYPATLAALAAFASDVKGVTTAEGLVQELRVALGEPELAPVWHVVSVERWVADSPYEVRALRLKYHKRYRGSLKSPQRERVGEIIASLREIGYLPGVEDDGSVNGLLCPDINRTTVAAARPVAEETL